MEIAINNQVGGYDGCFFVFYPGLNAVYLFTDTESGWNEVLLGMPSVQSNSHCQINGSLSSYSFSGSTLTLNINVEFLSTWIGANLVYYELAEDTSGGTSGWVQIPGATFFVTRPNDHPPSLGSGPTASGAAGLPQTIAFTASDPDGYLDLGQMDFVINNVDSGSYACFGVLFPYLNTVYVFENNSGVWHPVVLGQTGSSYSNSQCTVTGSGSSFTGSGTTGTLTLNITFTPAFAGTLYFWQLVEDLSDETAGWAQIPGSFTVTTTSAISLTEYIRLGSQVIAVEHTSP